MEDFSLYSEIGNSDLIHETLNTVILRIIVITVEFQKVMPVQFRNVVAHTSPVYDEGVAVGPFLDLFNIYKISSAVCGPDHNFFSVNGNFVVLFETVNYKVEMRLVAFKNYFRMFA